MGAIGAHVLTSAVVQVRAAQMSHGLSRVNDPAKNQILAAIQTASELFHRVVLVVGEENSGKTTALRAVARNLSTELLNVNLAVSAALLGLTMRQRALHLPDLLDQACGREEAIVLLDNLEILFDLRLQHDPLRLLQKLSRNRTIVASWSGAVSSGKLHYAAVGHDEYRSYDESEALIISLQRNPTVSTIK